MTSGAAPDNSLDPPLAHVRVLNASDSLGAYAGRIFADLGAQVIKLEEPFGDPERFVGPTIAPGVSAAFAFQSAGQQSIVLDRARDDYEALLDHLLKSAHILLTSQGPAELRTRGLDPADLQARYPRLIHVAMTPYGLDGPWADRAATDLTLLAAGGLLWLAGDPDRPPVRAACRQSSVATALHAAVGALIALLEQEETGQGQLVDVSAQEAVAHSLENAAQYYDLEGVIRGRTGGAAAEVANGMFTCHDGWVYLVAGIGGAPLGWAGLVEWLESRNVPGAAVLREPEWQDQSWRRTPEAARGFRALFEGFTADRTKQELYEEGQRHGVSIAPVSTPTDLLSNPQLLARSFFHEIEVEGRRVRIPGAPYRFDRLDIGPRGGPPTLGAHTAAMLL